MPLSTAISSYTYPSYLSAYERDFNAAAVTLWLQRNWWYSILCSAIYLLAIFGGQRVMRRRPGYHLTAALIGWNVFLSIFSILGTVRYLPAFVHTLRSEGLVYSACVCDFHKGVLGFWTAAFMWSKLFELVDTAFLVLRKRPVIFLHWYHHVTVMIYTWHAFKDHTAGGRWFIMMNYAVHSFMYTYYALRAMGEKIGCFCGFMVVDRVLARGLLLLRLSQRGRRC